MQEQKQATVVLINDEEYYLMALEQYFLRKGGLNVITAVDAESALTKMKEHEAAGGVVNVVVTDVNLPGKDGISFAEDIRQGIVVKNPERIYIIVDSGDPNLNMGPAEGLCL